MLSIGFLRRARGAARIVQHLGVGALLWEVADIVTRPVASVVGDLAWAMRRSVSGRTGLYANVLGHTMRLIPEDRGISRELAFYGVHEPLATRLLTRVLMEGMGVVDIGSNIGYFLLLEARLVGDRGRVIGLEPEPSNYQYLLENIRRNGYANVLPINAAAGSQPGTGVLHVAYQSNWHSLRTPPWKIRQASEVQVVTVDEVVTGSAMPHVDLIRMDIEGYEVEAFLGMRGTLRRWAPRLLVELHPHLLDHGSLMRFLDMAGDLGYEVESVVDRRWDHRLHAWRHRPQRLTMAQLRVDPRLTVTRRTVTVLFRHTRQ